MDYKDEKIEFEKEIERRSITRLAHFTKTDNLITIVGHKKIIPRSDVEKKAEFAKLQNLDHLFTVRDQHRLDMKKDFICLSIEHPNYFLFDVKQKEEEGIWCVITIKPYYLYVKDTLFCVTNAASNFSKSQGMGDKFSDFLKLFNDPLYVNKSFFGRVEIKRDGLRPCYTTDIQAEILVKGYIGFDDFISICFRNEAELDSAKTLLKQIAVKRSDYQADAAISKFIIESNLWSKQRN